MTYFIRKVDSTQWEDELPSEHNILNMAVDGITNCCKTSGNTLSIWQTSSNDPLSEENQKLLTGMAMSLDRPIPFTFIFLSLEELQSLGLELEYSLGDTPFVEVASSHRDISNLTLQKMGELAWVIHGKVNDDEEMKLVAADDLIQYTKSLFNKVDDLPDEKKSQKKWRGLYQ